MFTVMISKCSLHQRQEAAANVIGFCYGCHLKLLLISFFFPFQNMLEIISKHASDACIFSFTYNLIVTSWRASKVSYKLSISRSLSVFSDHFPFAIKDSDHSLTQTETSIRNPKGGQKPPALAAEGAS